jgi:hypothetical protein
MPNHEKIEKTIPSQEDGIKRISLGNGTQENPYTFNNNLPNSTSLAVIQEAVSLSWETLLKEDIFFKLNGNSFAIGISTYSEETLPICVAKNHLSDKSDRQTLKWSSIAVSIFTRKIIIEKIKSQLNNL